MQHTATAATLAAVIETATDFDTVVVPDRETRNLARRLVEQSGKMIKIEVEYVGQMPRVHNDSPSTRQMWHAPEEQ